MTDTIFLETSGIVVPSIALALPRAQQLATLLSVHDLPFLELVECRQLSLNAVDIAETVVFNVEVERPQHLVHDVRRIERIAVTFSPQDETCPEVCALRSDFPRVPHTNLRASEYPRSLCLYDVPWAQVSLRWTAAAFVERIRHWLAETARGTLHQEDQPLEPLILGSRYTIVLPPDLFDGKSDGKHEELQIRLAARAADCRVLVANRGLSDRGQTFLALSFVARPQMHGVIRHNPHNLEELAEFLEPAGVSLLDELRTQIVDWKLQDVQDKQLLLVLGFPVTRSGEQIVEVSQLWAFMTTKTIAEIGVDLGVLEKSSHGYGRVIQRNPERNGKNIPVDVVLPQFDLTLDSLSQSSGLAADPRRVVAVGAGALGSQVIKTLAASGFGDWCIIDEDIVLPHNLARHQLGRHAIGYPKALALVSEVNSLLVEREGLRWFEADILRPAGKAEAIAKEFATAELVLDVAAAIPVSRHLTLDQSSPARRVAAFLNPRGTDLVLLAEDANRTITLDCLEMQYYRAITNDQRLEGHLRQPDGRIRYARSCRDVTTTIPNHLVQMHAGIAAGAIRQTAQQKNASLQIWQADNASGNVHHLAIVPTLARRNSIEGWTLVVDEQLASRLAELRRSKLPRETGGVLIGAYDLVRQIVYVVDTIPSPPDSEEWPTLYIRGKRGLAPQVDKLREATDGQVEYIGEWHSHPDDCPCRPSEDDMQVFTWLTKNMDDAGLPALMAIVGQGGLNAWYLGRMQRSGGWEIEL